MTNPFALESIEAPKEPPTDNPFALGNIQNDQAAQLRNTMRVAVQTKAEAASEVSRLRKRYPAPQDVLLRNLEEARYIEAADIAGETLKVSPILANSLRNHPWLAREAHPDIKPLADMEQRVKQYGELKAWNGPAPTFGSVLSGLAKSAPQGFRAASAGLGLQMTDALEALGLIEPDPVVKANRLRKAAQAAGASTFTTPDFESSTASGVYGGVASTLRMLPGLGLSLVTKSPAPALASAGVQTEAESYVKYRARGADPGMAVLGAVGEGAVEVATELPAMKFLVGKLGKAGASEFIAGLIAREIPGEQVATLLQDAIDTAVANPDKTWGQYLNERPDAAYQTLVATLTQSALMGGVNAAVTRFARDSNAQSDATAAADHLQEQLRMAAAVGLRERNPEEFRSLVQSMADSTEGAPQEIYVDAEVLNQLGPEVLAQLPGVTEQMADALAANDVVSIPVGAVLTVAPGTPLEALLVENARIGDPRAMTQTEAKDAGAKAQEFLAQESARVIAQAVDQQAMQESSDRVKQAVLEQLNTVGRFRKEVNEGTATMYAAMYTTLAGEQGITPEQAWEQDRITFTGKTGTGPVLNAEVGQDKGSLRVTKDNMPPEIDGFRRLYHGGSAQPGGRSFDQVPGGGPFDGFFMHTDKGSSWGAHGDGTAYFSDIPEDKVLTDFTLNYELPYPETLAAFSKVTGIQEGDENFADAWAAVMDKANPDDAAERAGLTDPILDDSGLVAQKLRGRIAKELGFQAIEMLDEHGTSWLVVPGAPTTRAFDPDDANTLKQSARVTTGSHLFAPIIEAMKLSEAEVASTAMGFMTGLPGDMAFLPPYVGGIPDVVQFLHERRLASGLPVLDIEKPEDRTQLARLMAAEGLAAIRSAGNALAWYDQTIRETLSQMGVKYPELNTNPHARNAFLMAMAIASQGMNVETNLGFATEQYDAYRLTVDATGVGQFPEVGRGESSQQMVGNFRLANEMLREMGPELLRRFLATPFTVKELSTAGFDVGGELMDEMVLGSSVFGPKIGFGFYSNLSGNFDPVTMDMWFMRTKGRLAGTLPEMDPAKFAKQLTRFRDSFKVKGSKTVGIFAAQFDKALLKLAKTDDAAAVTLARLVNKAHQKDFKDNRARFDSGAREKSELVLASGTILQSMDKPTDAPTSGGERRLLRDVVNQATALVSEQYGGKVPSAAFQALIWYPEQELYSALGVKLAVTSQDYSGGANKLLEKEGFNAEQLSAARAAAQPRPGSARSADGATDAGAAGGDGQVVGGAGPLTLDERTQFLTNRNARIIGEQRAAAARVNFEVAPDPTDLDLVSRWRKLAQETRLAVSNRVAQRIVPKLLKALKAKGELLAQVGSYLDDTSPSFALRLDKGDPSTVSKMLGFILSQDSMMAIGAEAFEGSFEAKALRVQLGDKSAEETDQIYQQLRAIQVDGRQVIGGQSTSGGVMTILLDEQDDADVVAALVDEALSKAYNVKTHAVFAAFPEKKDYDYASIESDPPGDEGVARQRARDARAQAATFLREELDALDAQPAADGPLEQAGNSAETLAQGPLGTFNPRSFELALNEGSNLSTVHHEMAHAYLEILTRIAARPNPPAGLMANLERFLKWRGIESLEAWNAMTLDQQRSHHEALAEGYEQYLLTGKAPSLELQPLMRKLKAFMLNVYKSLKNFIASTPGAQPLPAEMVQFYDRMLASEEQIAQAEEVAGLLPDEDATAEAVEKLTARSLRDLKWTVNARNKEIKKLQAQAKELRKGLEAEVRAEVDAMPVYEAKDALSKLKKEGPVADAQMESIAEKYQFTSVDEMLQTIDAAGSKADVIEGMTDQRMLERHGDLIDQRAIEEAANEAVHNEARARSLATELRSQAEALNPRQDTGRTSSSGAKITVNAIVEAAKQFAANVVARTKIIDLKSKARQHTAAERRAGKRWQEATTKGQTAEAIKAKQDQVLNNAAAKAALDAAASMRKMLEYVNKFEKESVRKKLPPEYLDQIDQLLEAIDLRVSTTGKEINRRKSLAQWVESQQALGLDPILPARLLENMALTSFKEMTVDEFTDLTETIKNIEHLGRLKSKLLAAKDKREFDIIAEEIAQSIIANGGKTLPTRLEPDGRISQFFKGAWADHRKLNSLVHQMDGGVDNGPFYRAFVRSMNDAGSAENVMLEKATEALAKIYAPIEKLPGGVSGGKLFIPEIRNSLSRAGRLSVALNWGNAQNRQRVMDGDAWTEDQVNAILKTLSPVELQFVNDVWAHIDGYWPDVKAKQLRVSGVVEDKVEAVPFEAVASDGTVVQMRGGYYPIKYDGDRSIKADLNEAKERASEIMRGAVARPTTRRGHTQARVDEVVGRPVKKDLSVITQHVNQVVHDLAWHEWFIDANRLLNDSRIQGAIRDHHGPEIARTMMDNVNAIAVGDANRQGQVDKLLLLMRANVTRSIMGASLTTALLQPFGLAQSMARIGVVPVLKGAGRWAGEAMHMENTVGWINEKSDFMRLRSKTFNRELREISQRVQGKGKFMQVADASLFFLMQKLQMVADVPTWVGQYEKALAGGVDESTAIALADEAVLASQGGGTTKDMAAVQRNNPFLTQFYSYFSTTLQLVAEKTALTDFKNPRAAAGWLGDMALLAVIPAILPALITFLLKGGGEDDEPEDWAKRLAEWQASYLLGMFVGLRELPTLWSPFDYGGPPAAKLLNDGKRLVQQAGQGEIDDPAVIATIGFMGTALGLPTTQLIRSYKGWLAWDEGDAPATAILFGPPPKN